MLQSRHLTTADGLAANTVRHIFQDEEGYLWFGTNNGLSRYDGYSFRNYRQEAGIGDLRIQEVKEDAEHRIRISTIQGGSYCLDKATGRAVAAPRNEEAADSITRADLPTRSDRLQSEIRDERGNRWQVCRDGSLRFVWTEEGKEFVLPQVINDRISFGNSFIFRICYTRRGLIAIAMACSSSTRGTDIWSIMSVTNRTPLRRLRAIISFRSWRTGRVRCGWAMS